MKTVLSFAKNIIVTLCECVMLLCKLIIKLSFWTLYTLSRLITLPFRRCFAPQDLSSMSGIDFERFVAKWMGTQGYRSIKTTNISADYGIDILAVKDGVKIGVQCKRYTKSVGVSAIQEVTAGLPYYECEKGVVVTNSDFTKNAVDLALSNGIELIDGDELKRTKAESLLKNTFSLYVSVVLIGTLTLISIFLDLYAIFKASVFLPLSLGLTLICLYSLCSGITLIKEK